MSLLKLMEEYMIETNGTLPSLEAHVRLYHNDSQKSELLGFAELVIGKAFVIKDIRIVRSKSGDSQQPFILFPSKRGNGVIEAKYFGIAHPITSEAHQAASKLVLEVYRKTLGKAMWSVAYGELVALRIEDRVVLE